VEHDEGGLARAHVLGECGVLGEGDDGLPECFLVAADDGSRLAAVAGFLPLDGPAEEFTR